MKRVILFVMLTSLFMAGCNTSCGERLKNLYEKNQKALVQTPGMQRLYIDHDLRSYTHASQS